MGLQGQHGQQGYAMAALLVSLAVMSVLMSAVLPAWRHQATREKEAELVFRGEQYVRAIRLWEMKMGPGSRPPTFDMMVQQKFLRKKYKDPMTSDGEFLPLFVGANLPPQGQPPSGRGGRGVQPPQPPQPQSSIGSQAGGGGILGVASKSRAASIRIYKGASHYNEWRFIYANASSAPGGGVGQPMPGGRGGVQLPGGRGRNPGGPDGRGFGPGGRGIGPGGGGIGPGGRGPGADGNPVVFPPGRGGRF